MADYFMKDAIPNSDFTTDHPASDIPFIFRRRLNWGDSDTAEIGYVSKFIDFCQEAIEVWWEAILAINWYQLKKINLANPAVGLNIDFLKPVVVGDRMDIVVLIEKLGKTSITYKIEGHKVDGPLCFTGTFNHVCGRAYLFLTFHRARPRDNCNSGSPNGYPTCFN